MATYRLTISYDGTRYAGWQVQPNGVAIQQLIEEALATILQEEVPITGSGRTDAGVHALAQVAHFQTEQPLTLGRVHHSLNGLLPHDIRILDLAPAADDFHARYSATGKIYHYHLWTEKVASPFSRLYRLHYPYPLDREILAEAANPLIGRHDFTSFANSPTEGSVAKNPVRHLHRLDLVEQEGGWRFELEGNGFLYKMVRNVIGTLLEVAEGRHTPDDVRSILEARDRRRAGRAAPPQGLFLVSVAY